jgi:antitoxin YefM
MRQKSYTEARKTFAKTMEEVCADHAPVMVTRQNAEPVVMMSLQDYEAWEETVYLLKSPKNAEKLSCAVAAVRQGHYQEKTLLSE